MDFFRCPYRRSFRRVYTSETTAWGYLVSPLDPHFTSFANILWFLPLARIYIWKTVPHRFRAAYFSRLMPMAWVFCNLWAMG